MIPENLQTCAHDKCIYLATSGPHREIIAREEGDPRYCDRCREEINEKAGYSLIFRRPFPEGFDGLGLYRIHWKTGGCSLASVGCSPTGDYWLAPINWVAPSLAADSWEDMVRVEKLDVSVEPEK